MALTEEQKRRANLRRKRWNRDESPYFRECAICELTCDQLLASKGNGYNILSCPKKHTGDAFFPYKLKQMRIEEAKRTGAICDE